MKRNISKLSALVVATSMAMALSACGSDNDDKKNDHEPVEATGQFIDAAVANLDVYQNDQKISTTNAEGQFTYMTGSEVTFKLGQLTLGSTMPKAIVTPADLATDSDDVVEILQVLQSLDEDNNPENGIFIPQTTIDKLVTAKDLSEDDVSIEDTVKKDIPDLVLVEKQKALNHFNNAQETVKNSKELSTVADKFVGYWQQSCDDGNQQVIQFAKDSMSANIIVQTGQYLNRKYANNDCTGSYDETIEYSSTDPLTVQIMGTSTNDNGKLVVNAIRTEGTTTYLDNLVMLNDDTVDGGELSFDRKNTLAFDDNATIDDVQQVANQLIGYWKSECIQNGNESERVYLKTSKVNPTTIKQDLQISQEFDNDSCSGKPIKIYNKGMDVIDLSNDDVPTFFGNDKFTIEFTDNGQKMSETYYRLTKDEFEAIESSIDTDIPRKGYYVKESGGNDISALVSPNGGEKWFNGSTETISWMTQYITGDSVDLYVLHDNPSGLKNNFDQDVGRIINQKDWYKFASDVPNTGSFVLDPAILNGTGNAYMILVVSTSNNAKFDISNETFSLNEN